MPHDLTGKVWAVDSGTAIITTNPVTIHGVHVLFTTAAAGSCVIQTGITADNTSTGKPFMNIKTTGTSTANSFVISYFHTYGNQSFQGLKIITAVNVDTIQIITCNPL